MLMMDIAEKDCLALLSKVANRLLFYREDLRDKGFCCCHINIDWINDNCSKKDIDLHNNYLIELARESLLGKDTSKVVWNDEPNTDSKFLSSLKEIRKQKYGDIKKILKNPEITYQAQLSPCLYELEKAKKDKRTACRLADEYVNRKRQELFLHEDKIKKVIGYGMASSEATLDAFLNYLLANTSFISNNQRAYLSSTKDSIEIELYVGFVLKVTPNLIVHADNGEINGTMSAFMILQHFASPSFNTFIKVLPLLPDSFVDYGRFDSRLECGLNICAWSAALDLIACDISSLFQTA